MGLVAKHFASQVQRCTRWATEQVYNVKKDTYRADSVMWNVLVYNSCTIEKLFQGYIIDLK